ncbi:cell division protein ZapE [Bowmanella denitrificans]|uniref:cell division protein ZapE n=1 Tax=Bowmanella denitrificans TaxID=366582 RepID=UPI0015593A1C|nr:cell division protein ZapE [Bowmanella denitrificans]
MGISINKSGLAGRLDPAIQLDASQLQVHNKLTELARAIVTHQRATAQGLYIWGKVGRGKTMLMDAFARQLPTELVRRQHFHEFMQDLHQQLIPLTGKSDPLLHVARQLAKQCKVICFDEFFVSDIGDAMLLGTLFGHLFRAGLMLVATSNCAPAQLYRNGLQRQRFLPAIADIEHFCEVIELSGDTDYRLRSLTQAPCYFVAQGPKPMAALNQQLLQRYLGDVLPCTVEVNGRVLNCVGRRQQCIAFHFAALCEGPRSHLDYIALAQQFSTLLVFNVPELSAAPQEQIKARGTEDSAAGSGPTGERQVTLGQMDDATRRFIALIDQCYSSGTRVVISASVALDKLYTNGTLLFEFERLKSRLAEMGSLQYQQGKWQRI